MGSLIMQMPTLQNAYVLHAKPYREKSLICELLTDVYGRVTVMAHKQKLSNPYQVFTPLSLSLKRGNGELYFVDKLDVVGDNQNLTGARFYSGFYINELLIKLVKQSHDAESLFYIYHKALTALIKGEAIEPLLRSFELDLLAELGVLPDFSCEANSGVDLQAGCSYVCSPEMGFVAAIPDRQTHFFSAEQIKAIAERNWASDNSLKQAKYLMRQLIHFQLKGQVLKSRELFKQPNRRTD